MNWDDLRFFLAAAETGSLSAAAKRLRSNQPTVGRRIDALEAALGLKLFQRHKKGLALTQEGALILEQSRSIQSAALNIQRLTGGEHQQAHGSVRLAVPEGLGNEILIPGLSAFYKQHPGVKLILNVSSRLSDIARGEADIAIRLIRPVQADIVTRQLARMELGIYASRAYLKQHGRPTTEADLLTHQIIAYADELAGLNENLWLLSRSRSEHIVLQSDSTTSRLRATQAGLGLSIQPCMIVSAYPKLVRLLKQVPLPAHQIWIAYHKDLRRIARIRVVIEFLGKIFG